MASQSAGIAFPLTYDAAQGGPNYSVSDFRLTAGAALAVPDGSAFGGVQGVRAGSPSPLATIDGTTVTVAAHMGWLCPWTGNGCYTYALLEPQQVTVDSTTGSYKIAVVLEDKAAGHGNGETVYAKKYPGYTLDSQIQGLVVARVDNGVLRTWPRSSARTRPSGWPPWRSSRPSRRRTAWGRSWRTGQGMRGVEADGPSSTRGGCR